MIQNDLCLLAEGNLFTRTSYATAKLDLDNAGLDLSNTVGLVVRVKGDKQIYAIVLTLGELASLYTQNGLSISSLM